MKYARMIRNLEKICVLLIILEAFSIKFSVHAIFDYAEEIEKHRVYYENVKKIVNNNFDPCKNPIDYVCYNEGEPLINNALMDEASQKWLTSDSKENLTNVEIKTRHFYESCLKSNVTETYFKEFQWPISDENFKLHSIWEKFEAAGWPIIVAKVVPNEVLITYGSDYMMTRIESKEEKEQLLDTIIQKGISRNYAETIVTEIIEISNRMNDNFRKCPNNKNWYRQIKLKELKIRFSSIDWEGIIARQLEKSNFHFDINNDLIITVIDFKCTMDHFKFVTENMREVYNYFYWTSYKMNSKTICMNHTMKFFKIIFIAKVYGNYMNESELLNDLIDILSENMLKRIKNGLTNITKDEVRNIRNKVKFEPTFAKLFFNLEFLSIAYNDVDIDLNDFYANLRKMKNRKKFVEFSAVADLILTATVNQHKKPLYYAFSNLYPKLFLFFGKNNINRLLTSNDQQKIRECYESSRFNTSKILMKFDQPNIETYNFESGLLKISLEDYKQFINSKNLTYIKKDFEKIGLTAEKVFFINYSRDYCSKGVLEHMKFVINEMNMNDFQNEYHCPVGTAMNPTAENCYRI